MASFLYPYSGFKVLELQQQNTNSQNGCQESTLDTHFGFVQRTAAYSGCGAVALPETMWCLRLLLIVVLLPWSSSVKRGHTPAGTPLITEWFGEVSSAPADAVTSATPTSPLPPCRLIDETDELPATETPATPILDVTLIGFRRSLHLSEGGTTAWTKGGTEALQHVEKNCRVKVEGETTKVKKDLILVVPPELRLPVTGHDASASSNRRYVR